MQQRRGQDHAELHALTGSAQATGTRSPKTLHLQPRNEVRSEGEPPDLLLLPIDGFHKMIPLRGESHWFVVTQGLLSLQLRPVTCAA